MARINVWDEQLRRPKPAPVARVLKAEGCPDLPLTLRKLGPLETGIAIDRANETIGTHLEGRGDQAPLPLLFPGGRVAPLSRHMLTNVATLQAMQVPDEGDEPYQLLEWLVVADEFEELWSEVLRFSNEVQNGRCDPGNAPTPATGE